MDPFSPTKSAGAVRAIFWGAIVCLVDFNLTFAKPPRTFGATTQQNGFQCDIVSDMIGFAVIAFALSTIALMLPASRVRTGLRFAALVSLLSVASPLHDQILYDREPAAQVLELLFSSLQVVALCVLREHAGVL